MKIQEVLKLNGSEIQGVGTLGRHQWIQQLHHVVATSEDESLFSQPTVIRPFVILETSRPYVMELQFLRSIREIIEKSCGS